MLEFNIFSLVLMLKKFVSVYNLKFYMYMEAVIFAHYMLRLCFLHNAAQLLCFTAHCQ